MNSSDCIFCKIVAKQIPNYTVYEDDDVLAFLDIFPHAKGHTVVIPKQHYVYYNELPAETVSKLAVSVQKTMTRIKEVLSPDAFNVGWNDGKVAGQVVPHLHIHIFPRWEGDGGTSVHAIIKNSGNKSVEDLAELFRK